MIAGAFGAAGGFDPVPAALAVRRLLQQPAGSAAAAGPQPALRRDRKAVERPSPRAPRPRASIPRQPARSTNRWKRSPPASARLERAVAAPRAPVTDPVVLEPHHRNRERRQNRSPTTSPQCRAASTASTARCAKPTPASTTASASSPPPPPTCRPAPAKPRRATTAPRVSPSPPPRSAPPSSAATPTPAELAIVKPLATDTAAIAALEPFAATGVPSQTALGLELAAIVRPMLRAAGEVAARRRLPRQAPANAEKLVRIRPADEARGDDRTAILSRIEQRAAQGNVAGALSELAKLPAEARAPAQAQLAAWTAKRRRPHQGHRRQPAGLPPRRSPRSK